jgi:hypothetical protein
MAGGQGDWPATSLLHYREAAILQRDTLLANFIPDYGMGRIESGVKYGIGVGTKSKEHCSDDDVEILVDPYILPSFLVTGILFLSCVLQRNTFAFTR